MKKLLVAALMAVFAGSAFAQPAAIPSITNIGPNDVIKDIVGGVGSAQDQYVSPNVITGSVGYMRVIPLTAFNLSFTNGTQIISIFPAGTLATGTFNLSPNPAQGQKNCIRSSQTQSAVTLTPPTGTTITSAITSMTASTTYCYFYDAVSAKWDLF